MKAFLFTLLLSCWQPGTPPLPTALLQGFLRDAISHQLTNTALEEKYFCPPLHHSANGDKARALTDTWLSQLKILWHQQQVDPEKVEIIPYNSLSNKEVEIMGDTRQVYVAQYEGKVVCHFLVEAEKINSCLLLDKGGRAFFIPLCP